jgi:hypothetical protein
MQCTFRHWYATQIITRSWVANSAGDVIEFFLFAMIGISLDTDSPRAKVLGISRLDSSVRTLGEECGMVRDKRCVDNRCDHTERDTERVPDLPGCLHSDRPCCLGVGVEDTRCFPNSLLKRQLPNSGACRIQRQPHEDARLEMSLSRVTKRSARAHPAHSAN